MNRIRYTLMVLVSCLVTLTATAQHGTMPRSGEGGKTCKVAGRLVDSHDKPISYATVTLLRKDSTVVNGALSKDDGSFSISTDPGTYILRINAIGLDARAIADVNVTSAAPVHKMGNIKLHSSATNLKEVAIVGEKPLMEMKVDKKVFNVEKNTTTAGGSAADVLQNVPSVDVDADGTVSLRGKTDVTILIDGKPSSLLGSDVESALQSLPASSIASVEVITNPSAKYDAQGLTGIINIITKKDTRLGFNGNLTLGAGTRDKYNGNLGLNLHKGKWNVFLNSSFRINTRYDRTTTDRYNTDSGSYHTYDHSQRHFNGFFNSIGATYDFNSRNSLTFTEHVNVMNFGFTDVSDYNVYATNDETGPMVSHTHRTSDANGGPLSLSSSIDYNKKFKKKNEELDVNATYSNSDFHFTPNYHTYYYGPDDDLLYGGPLSETAPSTSTHGSFNAQADYTDPLFTKNGKLGLGWKTQVYWFSSSNNPIIDSANGAQSLDTTLWNVFNYTQQIHAGYINWSDKEGKFSYQAGLRLEDAIYQGTDDVINSGSYKNSFLNLFPSAFVSYDLPHKQSIYLNYSRRTNRPSFWQLLPYKNVSNPGFVEEGNPALLPEFIHNFEFSYSKQTNTGDNFIASAYYQYTENLIEKITTPDTGIYSDRLFKYPVNLASGTTYGLELTGFIHVSSIWDVTISSNLFQNEIHVGDAAFAQYASDQQGFSWFGKLNSNLKLPMGFSLQINAQYESPKKVAQGTRNELYWVDAAIKKSFLHNKGTLILNVSDIFNTRKYSTDYDLAAYRESYLHDRETRIGTFTFSYRFGKSNIGRNHRTNNMDEKPTDQNRDNNLKQSDNGNSGQEG